MIIDQPYHVLIIFLSSFPTGIPELGIEHFEPLVLNSVHVSRGSGSLVLNGGFKNLVVKGPSNTTVSRAVYVLYYFNVFFVSLVFQSIK